jgi:capsid protein
MIDPTREIPALISAVRAGIMSLSEVQRSFGYVPEEIIAELAIDMQRAKDAGLTLSVDPGLVSDSGVAQAAGNAEPAPPDPAAA